MLLYIKVRILVGIPLSNIAIATRLLFIYSMAFSTKLQALELNICSTLHKITAFIDVGAQNVSDRTFFAIFLLHADAGLPRMRAT